MRLVGTCWNPSACIGPQKHWDFRPQKKIRLKAHWLNFGEVCIQLLHWFVVSCIVPSSQTVPYNPFPTLIVNRNGMLAAKIWLVGWWFQFFHDDVLSSWAVLFLTTARMLLHGSAMLISRSAEVLWRAIHQQLSVVRLHLRIGREKLQETTLWH